MLHHQQIHKAKLYQYYTLSKHFNSGNVIFRVKIDFPKLDLGIIPLSFYFRYDSMSFIRNLLFTLTKANRTMEENYLKLKYNDPELSGQTIRVLFLSIVPQQFGKFHI